MRNDFAHLNCASRLVNFYLVVSFQVAEVSENEILKTRSTFVKNDRNFKVFTRVCTLLVFALSAIPSFAADEFVAQAVSVSGKVLVRGEGTGTVQMTFLKPGDKLYKGSIVNTGSNGAVKLLMTDRTIVDLGPSSLFKVNDYALNTVGDRKVDVSLDYGQVRTSVNEKITSNKGKFTIRTKAATMGVRGTEFVVSAPVPSGGSVQPPKTSLTVMHGKVEVANTSGPAAAPMAVTPGMQFAKSGDGPGQVAQLNTQEVAQIKSDAFQKDMTFMQTVSFDASSNESSSSSSSSSQQSRGDQPADKAGEPPATGGSQTLESIATNVESTAKDAPPPQISDLRLPGTFMPDVPLARPIDQLNGRFVNLKVRICLPGQGC
jgi:hypothetical protein